MKSQKPDIEFLLKKISLLEELVKAQDEVISCQNFESDRYTYEDDQIPEELLEAEKAVEAAESVLKAHIAPKRGKK